MIVIHRADRIPPWPMPAGYAQSPLRWFVIDNQTFWIRGAYEPGGWSQWEIVDDEGDLVGTYDTLAELRAAINTWI